MRRIDANGQSTASAPSITGTYILNSGVYYLGTGKGVLGGKAQEGPFWAPDTTWYAGSDMKPIDALLMCDTGENQSATEFDATAGAHRKEGVNVSYDDGHVRWLSSPASVWGQWIGRSQFAYGSRDYRAGGGLWPWTTFQN